jgi:hypothetical protein
VPSIQKAHDPQDNFVAMRRAHASRNCNITASIYHLPFSRGHSSVGRAPALQAGSQGFESPCLQNLKIVFRQQSFARKILGAKGPRKRNLIRSRLFWPKPAGWQPALPRKIRVDSRNLRFSVRKEMPDVNLGLASGNLSMCSKETLGRLRDCLIRCSHAS